MALANVLVGVGVSTGGAVVATNSLGNLKDDLGKLQESKGNAGAEHMLGEKGTQVRGSKTTGQNGKTERVDVENPAPGKRPGDVHYHDSNNTKWRYDVNSAKLVDPSTGEFASPKTQKALDAEWVQKAVEKALNILGE